MNPALRHTIPAALVAVALSVAAWAWLGRPIALPDVPNGRFECLSYAPTSDAGSPLTANEDGFVVPEGLIERDLVTLSRYTDCVRIYSAIGRQGDVVPAAAAAGMQVLLGAWISADPDQNRREIERALSLTEQYPETVRAVIVGNEVLLRREMSGEKLADLIRTVAARTDHPVTYAEISHFWRNNRVVADAVDYLTVHILPHWDDPYPVHIDVVQDHVQAILDRIHADFPGKEIQIGEIGWPSAGRTRAVAKPSLVNEARFLRTFAANAESHGVRYNIIEAIDQPWKRVPEGTVGGYWGILDADRHLKFPLTGPVSEWPSWPLAALFTAVLSVASLAWATAAGKRLTFRKALSTSLAAAAAGIVIWQLAVQATALAIGWTGALWAAYLIVCGVLGGAYLVYLLGVAEPGTRWTHRPAAIGPVMRRLRRAKTATATDVLGLAQWAVLLPAAIVALLLATDGRHRDFLSLAFCLPAAAFVIRWWLFDAKGSQERTGAEEAWIAGLLIVAGLGGIDHPGNREAWLWAACCFALAAPWLPGLWGELVRLTHVRLSSSTRKQQRAQHEADG